MKKSLKKFQFTRRSRLGQSLTEYLILTALVGVGSIAVVQLLGSNLQVAFGKISEALRGQDYKNEGKKLRQDHYSIKDLGDFNSAFQDNESKN